MILFIAVAAFLFFLFVGAAKSKQPPQKAVRRRQAQAPIQRLPSQTSSKRQAPANPSSKNSSPVVTSTIIDVSGAAEKIPAQPSNDKVVPTTPPLSETNYGSPSWYSLGTKHRKVIPMSDAEAILLDNLYYGQSSFFEDPFCQSSTIGLFLRLYRALEDEFNRSNISLDQRLTDLADLVARKHYHYRPGSDNYKYSINSVRSELRQSLMKLSENAVRELYDYKRRLQVVPQYVNPQIAAEIESQLVTPAKTLLPDLIKACPLPDEKTELIINVLSPTRWKAKFDTIKDAYTANGDIKFFQEQIFLLAKQNKDNPAIENIFFEASKFIGKKDKVLCLSLYAYYIYQDQQSSKIDDKALAKTIQKAIFSSTEHESQFDAIIEQLKKDKNLKTALAGIATLFQTRRKRIELHTGMIKEAEQALHETVDLLNEYLVEDEDTESSAAILKTSLEEPSSSITASPYLPDLGFSPIQISLLIRFERHRFLLGAEDVEIFARVQNCFKNQLVNSINEACFECLEDSLIEEENENYIINEEYYKKILAV